MLRQPDCPELARDLARLLDGTRSVSEAMASFPHCRFEAYQTLADLSERHALRLAGGDDLVALAQRLVRHDPERAWKIVERGLRETPHPLGLLTQQVAMAESLDRLESASEALKLVVHLNLEAGERDVAKQGLERAKRLSPSDTALWERSLALALDERRAADAVRDGRHLVELYRAPGLHRKAERVLATLVRLHPGSWELRRDWAHCLADCGDPAAAVEVLSRHARKLLAAERDDDAAAVLEEILAIDPGQRAVKAKLAEIDEGLLARRREGRRRLVRRLAAAFVLALLAVGLVLESRARFEYSRAERVISEQSLIERGHYEEALGLLERVRERYPWCTISLFELRGRIRTLESKAAALRASDDG
jgi:tetratricopeptide (TPR) repeat protein